MSEPTDTCDVYEYDGAFRCDRHKRLWGAVTDPAEPCAEVESKPGGGWHRGCRTIVDAEGAREREEGYRRYDEILERHRAARPDPDTLLRDLVRDVLRGTRFTRAHRDNLVAEIMATIDDPDSALARVRERMR